jgi:alkylated DNA repair dioxygenase AlkB
MEHAGDELVVMEQNVPDWDGIDEQDVREAMADALRRDDAVESHTLAQAYEDGEEIVMHQDCHDKTSLPMMYEGAGE